jgi:hypothetical protein
MMYDPLAVLISGYENQSVQAVNSCTERQVDVTGDFPTWWTDNSSIATASGYQINGIAVGSTNHNAQSINMYWGPKEDAPSCDASQQQPSAPTEVLPHITSISPAQGLIGNTVSVTIAGRGFGTSPTIVTVQGVTATVQSANDTQITASFAISVTPSVTGNANVQVVNQAANVGSNIADFYIQVPTKLVRTDFPGVPNGYGPLVVLTNGNVVNAGGQVLLANQCGMYRNLVYSLQDQQTPGQDIDGTYTLVEMFSNYSSTFNGTIPPTQNFNMTPGGLLSDIQFIGKTAPNCPGSDDHESFTQSHQVLIGTGTFPLTTVNSIQRGNYSGTAHVDVTITTP